MARSYIYVVTGNGAGKTTSTLGVALRQVGHCKKAVIVQFLKGRKNIGEYKVMKKLMPYYEIHQFGRPGWVDLANPSEKDKALARKGLEFAKQSLKKKPSLLVLDEVNYAMAYKMLPVNDVLKLLKSKPAKTSIYLTGRHAPKPIRAIADFVTEIVPVKRPKKIFAKKGIEY